MTDDFFSPYSKEYQLRGKKKKEPSKGLKPGKKTKEWASVREELIDMFREMGITECEIQGPKCWHNNALGFAHLDKRRKLTVEDLWEVVLACTVCHQMVEEMPAEKMKKLLEKIIARRKK